MKRASESQMRLLAAVRIAVSLSLLCLAVFDRHPPYAEGVLKGFAATGIFHLFPAPMGSSALEFISSAWIWVLILATLGLFTRTALAASFIFGCYVLGYSYNFGRIFHGTSLSLLFVLALCFAPCSARWSVDSFWRRIDPDERSVRWGIKSVQALVCLAYFSSGIFKLVHSGWAWAWSENLAIRIFIGPGHTHFGQWLLDQNPLLLRFLAVAVLSVELLSLLPLFFKSMRMPFVIAWTAFHISVSLTLGHHFTFFSQLAGYVAFLPFCFKCEGHHDEAPGRVLENI